MFRKIFTKKDAPTDSELQDAANSPEAAAELAATLLIAPTALMQMTLAEAHVVVRYMHPQRIATGTIFIREGDGRDTGFMLLLLDGEVTVETRVASRNEPIVVMLMAPGSLIGELSLLDGKPRNVSCIAATPLRCAVLTRERLELLMNEHPKIAAKLLLALALRVSERLRDSTDKLKMYVQLTQAMEQEIASRASLR